MGAAEKLTQAETYNKPRTGLYLVESQEASLESGDTTSDIRRRIKEVAKESYQEGYISEGDYNGYLELTKEKKEEIKEHMMDNMLKFASNYHEINKDLRGYLKIGIAEGYMSATDEKYWMEKYIKNPDVVKDYDKPKSKSKFLEKVENRKRNRKTYDELTQHRLVKEGKVYLGALNSLFKVDEFLKAEAPKRVEFLNALHKEIERLKHEEVEEMKLREVNIKQYKGLLEKEWKAGTIGEKTHDEFLGEFILLDVEDQKSWISGIKGEMSPRQVLRAKIEKLPKQERAMMEEMREEVGYHDLLTAYVSIKPVLKGRYMEGIGAHEGKLFGRHTVDEFEQWINGQNIDGISHALSQLDHWMNEYKKVWVQAEALTEEERGCLKEKVFASDSNWGLTEMRRFVFDPNFRKQYQSNAVDMNRFRHAESTVKKEAMASTVEKVKEQGRGTVHKLFQHVTIAIRGRTHKDKIDSIEESAAHHRALRKEKDKQSKKEGEIHNSDNVTSLQDRIRRSRSKAQEPDLPEHRNLETDAQVIDMDKFRPDEEPDEAFSAEDYLKRENVIQKVEKTGTFTQFIFDDEVRDSDAVEMILNDDNFENMVNNITLNEQDDVDMKVFEGGKTFDLNLLDMRDMQEVLEEELRTGT